jgi:type VI secretion system protein ImpA
MTELTALLQPLPDTPTGADLSFSPEFDAIAEMRRADDPSLSQGEWVTDLKTADWPGVVQACEALLSQRSKDLRVASWLTEAWAQVQGYAGLADGIALSDGLCQRFWADLHPLPDGTDFDLRSGALSHLLGHVVQLAKALPVLQRGTLAYALRDMDVARALGAALAKARDPSEVPTAGKPTPEDIARAQRETPPSLIADRLLHARRARQALLTLQATVDSHLGDDGPGFSAAKSALDDAVHALERLAREAGVAGGSAATGVAPTQAETSVPTGGQVLTPDGGFGGAPATRAQALTQLRLVADYFRTHEPHSPVAYLAERAAHWGELPLHEWLRLVMKDGSTLAQLEELLGVEPRRAAD